MIYSASGRCHHSSNVIALDRARSCWKISIWRAAKAVSVMLRFASSLTGQVIPGRFVELAHHDARTFHQRDLCGVELAAAEPIEQQVNFHAGPRPFGERLGEFPTDRAGPIDVTPRSSTRKII
jgi:hypothetical protein